MENIGIYQIVNKINGKSYIGSSINLKYRKYSHFRELKHGIHHSQALQRAYNKYGKDSFEYKILLTCNKEDCIKYEQEYLDTLKPEYNICSIAGNCLGRKFSEESKSKMRKAKEGFKHSEETKQKMLGRTHNEEVRDRISNSMKLIKPKRLSEQDILDIKSRLESGEKGCVLSKEYKISATIITRIKKNKY